MCCSLSVQHPRHKPYAIRHTPLRALTSLLTIKLQSFHHWHVAHGKENRVFIFGAVLVTVPTPQRDHEAITLIPVELLTVDNGRPAPPKSMINGAAVMSVGLGCLVGPEHLNATR